MVAKGGGSAELPYSEAEQPTDAQRSKQMELLKKLLEEHEASEENQVSEDVGRFPEGDLSLLRQLYRAHARYMRDNNNSPRIYASPLLTRTRHYIRDIRARIANSSGSTVLDQFNGEHAATFTPPDGFIVPSNSLAGTILRLKTKKLPVDLGSGLFLGVVLGGTLGLLAQTITGSRAPTIIQSTKKPPHHPARYF